tara:strand:- start:35 stop:292 length:258 start_codon:yes stop_codon:yes gene_type:complete
MGVLFASLLYLNVRAGLDKLWLISILGTLAVLVVLGYWTTTMLCEENPSRYCGIYSMRIWSFIAPAFLNLQQFAYLIITKRRLTD